MIACLFFQMPLSCTYLLNSGKIEIVKMKIQKVEIYIMNNKINEMR